PIDAAFFAGSIGSSEHGREELVGVMRIDRQGGNLHSVLQAKMRPCLSCISGLVDPISNRKVRAVQTLAAAYVHDIGIGGSDCDGPNRLGRLIVKDRIPGSSIVVG